MLCSKRVTLAEHVHVAKREGGPRAAKAYACTALSRGMPFLCKGYACGMPSDAWQLDIAGHRCGMYGCQPACR